MPDDQLPALLCDAQAIAADLNIAAGTVANWKHQGKITAHGRDHRGRTLYDFDEVEQVANDATHKAKSNGGWARKRGMMKPQ